VSGQVKLSRRELLFGRLRAGIHRAAPLPGDAPKRAVIQGRYCMTYHGLMCSTCFERCPEPGAIIVEQGIPRVESGRCTGCGDCHTVCPAPTNAILMTTPRPTIRQGGA
jgi:Pyruvate/2-oxoacid:ferredoxin oxidoreductase delta subunit